MIAQMIPFVQKASNICRFCRVRKQKCDRMLPRCDRCTAKNQHCDYTPPAHFVAPEPEPLIVNHKVCGHADLSPCGATKLVHAVKACIDAPLRSDLATDLLDLTRAILDSVGFNLAQALTAFGPCIQQWCPIMLEDEILGGCDYPVLEPVNAQDGPKNPVIWLSIWLVLRKPCSLDEDMGESELYTALKQVHALFQTATKLELSLLQTGLIIAVYEIGHGLRQQAFQTIGSCVATLRILELEAERKHDVENSKALVWLKASLAMVDRELPLSMITSCLPLSIPTSHPTSRALSKTLTSGFPQRTMRNSASSPWKVFVRTGAALSAGSALEYVHSRQQGVEPEMSYDEVDGIVNRCISMLVVKQDSPDMFHCDAVPMTFCSHIILQSTQIQYIHNTLHDSQIPDSPEYLKVMVALRFSRNMAWEMVRTMIRLVRSEAHILRITLAGLCSVLRAGLAVLETKKYISDEVAREGEVEAYLRILTWFSNRWTIGKEYLARAREILGHP